ncbi:hypothetical protein NIASO_14780 [Niabella soli DSM 19437]|uniref:Uncharacterized protein n=1 Tax=Niabella soli DSM 19437 TaxID=929713 RepID=W0F8N5_9BACT|nr:hypothetical protein NIASO_14780 [Niabella soli DSM 19437]
MGGIIWYLRKDESIKKIPDEMLRHHQKEDI